MFRFCMSRAWTLILALSLCLAYIASQPSTVRAEGGPFLTSEGGDGGSFNGDPDIPTVPPKRRVVRGAVHEDGRLDSMRSVGDGRVGVRVVMWRVLAMLRGFRGFYFHF
jgi:hypothetical protein